MNRTVQRVALPEIVDERGHLMFAQESQHIPFSVKRIFCIYNVPSGVERGGHAHRVQEQFLVMINGECVVVIDDGFVTAEQPLRHRTEGLYVPAGIWLELSNFGPDAICLVLSSGRYDEADYIRDYREFRAAASKPRENT
jgi:dTDP-4-dehydrorhamnose 3,5-epimerase-like enzyme